MNDDMREQPWSSGPAELLRHGLSHLSDKDTDVNRRIAMLSIDNAVELMLKTYLGLPWRETGIQLSRSEIREMNESFPRLLEGIEKLAPDRLVGVDPTAVEWFHRLRNQLYHEGNGLTVERDKIAIYATLAQILFKNLFDYELDAPDVAGSEAITEYLKGFDDVRAILLHIGGGRIPTADELAAQGAPDPVTLDRLAELQDVRNRVAHGDEKALNAEHLEELDELLGSLTELNRVVHPVSTPEDPESVVKRLRTQNHSSWSSLLKAISLLEGRRDIEFSSANVEYKARRVVRRMLNETGLELNSLRSLIESLARRRRRQDG